MTIKLLAVGDLHLGRQPPGLPASLQARRDEFSPAAAWQRVVDLARRQSVAAVLLAGDVAESSQDYFEALPRLRTGAAALQEAGIELLAVSGNHDVDILPRLIADVPGARLLGSGGEWQCVQVPGRAAAGAERVSIWGWSFPDWRVHQSPLAQLPAPSGPGPHIGLLHCDRDQSDSPYAPVRSEELRQSGLDAWLLGHIHQPDALDAARPTGYLGSVVGLDAGEPGPRGPWLIEIEAGRIQRFEQRAIAPLRWQRLDVDITGADSPAAVASALAGQLAAFGAALAAARDQPDVIAMRLHLTGDCDMPGEDIEAALPEADQHLALPGAETIQWFVERREIDTRPVIALARLAERDDQPGLLARRLLILQRDPDDPARRALLEAAGEHLRRSMADNRWSQLPGPTPDPATLAEWLRRRGQDALRAMLAQERG